MDGGRQRVTPDRIIAAISEKLEANQSYLAKSRSGRVTWRIDRDGNIEVFLEPKI